tara:strand:+ start:261 stop:599 length:339 start_codon:yes stop_codon:yes gene_type:complete
MFSLMCWHTSSICILLALFCIHQYEFQLKQQKKKHGRNLVSEHYNILFVETAKRKPETLANLKKKVALCGRQTQKFLLRQKWPMFSVSMWHKAAGLLGNTTRIDMLSLTCFH